MDIKSQRNKIDLIYVTLILFLPTVNFYLYYAVNLVFLFLYFTLDGKKIKYSTFLLIISCSSLYIFRGLIFSNIEDIKELIKLIIFIVVISKVKTRNFHAFYNVFFYFVTINFLVSLCQFLKLDFYGINNIISLIYNAEHHRLVSLNYAIPRSLGLSSGPSQQAVISLFMLCFFSTCLFKDKEKKLSLLLIVFSSATILMSQSKSMIISVPIGLFLFGLICTLKIASTRKLIIIFFVILFPLWLLPLFDYIKEFIPELSRLHSGNLLEVSSVQARFENWRLMIQPVFTNDNFLMYLFGPGRSFLFENNVADLPFDSDFIYIFINLGLLGLIVYVFLIFSVFWGFLVRKYNNSYSFLFTLLCSISFCASFTLNVYLEPKFFILVAVFIAMYRNDKKSNYEI